MAWRISIDQESDKDMVARTFAIASNKAKIEEDREALAAKYGNDTYVAYFGGKEIDHDKSIEALRKRLAERYPEKIKSMAVERVGGEKIPQTDKFWLRS
jgi:hypothetical protein